MEANENVRKVYLYQQEIEGVLKVLYIAFKGGYY
jgi:hypothetical protein